MPLGAPRELPPQRSPKSFWSALCSPHAGHYESLTQNQMGSLNPERKCLSGLPLEKLYLNPFLEHPLNHFCPPPKKSSKT